MREAARDLIFRPVQLGLAQVALYLARGHLRVIFGYCLSLSDFVAQVALYLGVVLAAAPALFAPIIGGSGGASNSIYVLLRTTHGALCHTVHLPLGVVALLGPHAPSVAQVVTRIAIYGRWCS